MIQNVIKVSTHDFMPYIDQILRSGRKVKINVTGNSMRPFIVNNRDKVLISGYKTLKKGDIILFKDKNREYKLHRIFKINGKKYRTIGDYCLKEDGLLEQSDIIGVVEIIVHKGKNIVCDSLWWQLFSHAWLALLPIRKYLISIHKVYINIKIRLKQNRYYLVYIHKACIEHIKKFLDKGRWLSRYD